MMDGMAILAAAAAPAPGGLVGGLGGMLVPMVLIFAIFYFMLIRPQQRKDKERRDLVDNVKTGAKVMFSGGILGTVSNVKEHTFIIKIADNVRIEVSRGAVTKVLEKGDKAVEEAAA
jgi:preprotein translocase subunit YajC